MLLEKSKNTSIFPNGNKDELLPNEQQSLNKTNEKKNN